MRRATWSHVQRTPIAFRFPVPFIALALNEHFPDRFCTGRPPGSRVNKDRYRRCQRRFEFFGLRGLAGPPRLQRDKACPFRHAAMAEFRALSPETSARNTPAPDTAMLQCVSAARGVRADVSGAQALIFAIAGNDGTGTLYHAGGRGSAGSPRKPKTRSALASRVSVLIDARARWVAGAEAIRKMLVQASAINGPEPKRYCVRCTCRPCRAPHQASLDGGAG